MEPMKTVVRVFGLLLLVLLVACTADAPVELPEEQSPQEESPEEELPQIRPTGEQFPEGESSTDGLRQEQQPAEEQPGDLESEADSPPEPTRDRSTRLEPADEEKLPERVPTVDVQQAVVGEVPRELMTAVLNDLAQRTSADPDDVRVIRAEEAIWNDGSLGCAKPGEMYTQAIVHGYWINLEYTGVIYDYRANDNGYFFLCESPLPGSGGAPTG